MKKIIIFIGSIAVISMLTISGVFVIKNTNNNELSLKKESYPTILGCYNSVYGKNEEVTIGYATLRYDYLIRNEKKYDKNIEIDWGDKTSSVMKDVSDLCYIPHKYENSGEYFIKVKYQDEKTWSKSFKIIMKDFYDLEICKIYTKPEFFRPFQKINLCVDIKNTGTISSSNCFKVSFFYKKENQMIKIGEEKVDGLGAKETKTIEKPFRWFNNKNSYNIYVELDLLDGELFDENNINNDFIKATTLNLFKKENHFPLLSLFFSTLINLFSSF